MSEASVWCWGVGGKKWNGSSRLIRLTRPLLGIKGEGSTASWPIPHHCSSYSISQGWLTVFFGRVYFSPLVAARNGMDPGLFGGASSNTLRITPTNLRPGWHWKWAHIVYQYGLVVLIVWGRTAKFELHAGIIKSTTLSPTFGVALVWTSMRHSDHSGLIEIDSLQNLCVKLAKLKRHKCVQRIGIFFDFFYAEKPFTIFP